MTDRSVDEDITYPSVNYYRNIQVATSCLTVSGNLLIEAQDGALTKIQLSFHRLQQ